MLVCGCFFLHKSRMAQEELRLKAIAIGGDSNDAKSPSRLCIVVTITRRELSAWQLV